MAITQIQNDTFRDAIIDMDSKRFFSCVFTNCRLRYAGGQCEWDKNTIFTRCTWEFVDSALRSKQIFDLIQMSGGSGGFSLKSQDFFTH